MTDVMFLMLRNEKQISKEFVRIDDLKTNVTVIKIPDAKRIKRKEKKILLSECDKQKFVFSNDDVLKKYCKKEIYRSFMHYFPYESTMFCTNNAGCDEIAFYTEFPTAYFLKTMKAFSLYFPFATVCTNNIGVVNRFATDIFQQSGFLVHVKAELCKKKTFVVNIADTIEILNTETKKVISDVEIAFSKRFDVFNALPLKDFLKLKCEQGECLDVLKKGKVKIVGEISK